MSDGRVVRYERKFSFFAAFVGNDRIGQRSGLVEK